MKRIALIAALALAALFGGHLSSAQAACTAWGVNTPYLSAGYGVFNGWASCSGNWIIFLYAEKLYQGSAQTVESTAHYGWGTQFAQLEVPGPACGVWYRTELQAPYLDAVGPWAKLC
jgi:hypothetical protein